MLNARNLDDQTYEEIVKAAQGRLPWLSPPGPTTTPTTGGSPC